MRPRIGIIPVRRKLAPGHNWSAVASITWRPADGCRPVVKYPLGSRERDGSRASEEASALNHSQQEERKTQRKGGGAKSGGVAKQKSAGNVGKLSQNMDKAIQKQVEKDIVSRAQHLHFSIVTDSARKGKLCGKVSKGTCK